MTAEEIPAEITADELAASLQTEHPPVLLDVRETWEFELVHLPGSLHIPMGALMSRSAELDPAARIVTICHHGIRSLNSALYLRSIGMTNTQSLQGGLDLYAKRIDPKLPRY